MVAKGKLKLKTLVFLLKRFNWTSNVGFVVPYIIIFKKWKQQMDINENKSLWKIGCVDDGIKKNLSNMCNSNLWDPNWFLQVRCYLHIWLPTWSASWGMKHTVATWKATSQNPQRNSGSGYKTKNVKPRHDFDTLNIPSVPKVTPNVHKTWSIPFQWYPPLSDNGVQLWLHYNPTRDMLLR
jgi:hypothetical protein